MADVTCPKCGANGNEICTTVRGNDHAARRAAEVATIIPKVWAVGEKAEWWHGPGHQSTAIVTVSDGPDKWGEYDVLTPDYMHERWVTVHGSELHPLRSDSRDE
jgi:hypothetical protein